MKKLIFNSGLFGCLLSITIIYSCKKDKPELADVIQQQVTYPVDSYQEYAAYKNSPMPPDIDKAPKHGEFACVIRDRTGKAICAGTRCGSPNGKCGKETKCECLKTMISIDTVSNGMHFIEFAARWNTDTGRIQLIKQGFHEVDHF